MLLGNYFHNININYKNFSFSGISFDSAKIKKDNIFFAIKGIKFDGNDYIDKVIKKGVKIIVTEKKIKRKVNFFVSDKVLNQASLVVFEA